MGGRINDDEFCIDGELHDWYQSGAMVYCRDCTTYCTLEPPEIVPE